MNTCPVLLLTPFVQEASSLFDVTHEIRLGDGVAYWSRVSLPVSGGIDRQPAKMLQALSVICNVKNDEIAYSSRKKRDRRARRG